MLANLRKLLGEVPRESPLLDKRLAAAVLLLEAARADFERHAVEIEAVRQGLVDEFGLAPEAVDELIRDAERRTVESVSLYDFVETLNKQMSPADKQVLMEMLWKVVYADGRVDPQEEHLLRRLADMLYVSHADFIRGKLAAEKSQKT